MPRQKPIDLRSDMLGRRPEKVMAAMTAAVMSPSMDDEDACKRALEERVAEMVGCEDALFLPTCTIANQIVVRHLSSAGATIIAEGTSHLVQREFSAATAYHAARIHVVSAPGGHLCPPLVASSFDSISRERGDGSNYAIWLEETHNAAGGVLMPPGWLAEIACIARWNSAWIHIDGARLWNASVASGKPLRQLVEGADSLAISLNKCLNAPVGGLLAGTAPFIEWARAARTDLGGRWRPVGFLAAAALAALDDFKPRIAEVHRRARRFHTMLAETVPKLAGSAPETNIVMLHLGEDGTAERFLTHLRSLGVDALAYGSGRVRFVIHSGIADGDLAPAVDAIRDAAKGIPG